MIAAIRSMTLLALIFAGFAFAPAADAGSRPGAPGALLTGPSGDSPQKITHAFLREHRPVFGLGQSDLTALRLVARDLSPDGITHLRFNQVLDGIESFDRGVEAHVNAAGRLIAISSSVVPGATLETTSPGLDAGSGLREAHSAVNGQGSAARPRLRWTLDEKEPVLAWQSFVEGRDGGYYDVLVAADDGDLLRRHTLDSKLGESRYFPLDPSRTPATDLTMPPAWYDDSAGGTRLWGNNARTYTDPGNEDPAPGEEAGGTRVQIPSSNGSPSSPDWLYTPSHSFPGASPCPVSGCTWNSASPGTSTTNQFQAGSNLHVLVNRFHDHLASAPIGFDEAAGNFQRTNSSGNGLGGDYLRAELNDGASLNNARMTTFPDGIAPRMSMYLFSDSNTNGADAADVVYHEYTHGLSNRLVVNAGGSSVLSAVQSQMMGEGWSDFYAQDLLVSEGWATDTSASGELTVGTYVTGNPGGIRAKPIDCPVDGSGVPGCNGTRGVPVAGGFTYGDLAGTNNSTPHNGGEVWSETLWDIREAFGRQAALKLITGGMRLISGPPSILDARDAILQQAVATRAAPGSPDDFYPGLWQIFADRGMGAGASTPDAGSTTPTESYSLPTGLQAGTTTISDPRPGGDGDGRIEAGERFEVDQEVKNIALGPLTGVSGTLSSSDPVVVIEDGSASWPSLPYGGSAFNADGLAGRLPAGVCSATSPVTIDVTSSGGGTSKVLRIDPRPGSGQEVPLNDGTPGSPDVPGITVAGYQAVANGPVTDLDVRIDELRHTYLEDLEISVIHQGISVSLLNGFGGDGQDVIDAVFDDEAAGSPSSTPVTGRVKPAGSLSAFDGLPAAGLWQLRIVDSIANDTGVLKRWGIDSPQTGCGPDEVPSATTGGAASLSRTAVTLAGTVTPNGVATGSRISFGKTANYGTSTAERAAGSGETAKGISETFGGLDPATTYHYRVEAIRNGTVVAVGIDRSFRTLPPETIIDSVAPRIGKVRVILKRVGRTKRSKASFRFSIDEPARVSLKLTRITNGARKVRRRITRRVRTAGKITMKFGRALGQDRYKATVTAIDSASNRSRPKVVKFRVRSHPRQEQ